MRYLSWQLDEMSRSDHHLALRDERVERHRAGIKLQGRRLARHYASQATPRG